MYHRQCAGAAAAASVRLFVPIDCSLPGSSVHVHVQVRILKCVAMPSSRGSSLPRDRTHAYYVSCIALRFFTTSTTWEAQVGVLRDCEDRNKSHPFI